MLHEHLDGVHVSFGHLVPPCSLQNVPDHSGPAANDTSDTVDLAISCGEHDGITSGRRKRDFKSGDRSLSERHAALVDIADRWILEWVVLDLIAQLIDRADEDQLQPDRSLVRSLARCGRRFGLGQCLVERDFPVAR